ncbi:hypothetical protein CYMTET_11130 [Cymbomonas tetramitiformis]|uniref:Uncharacterized protein n=1 Tax=Cymbomonas tetramitiformis TaxID=36881 RepID=A0AAE0LDR8_9CHLO|nr:hypothetical protein CYMTET_11130 [Cymbomonas tetramitiformis]
MGRLSCCFKPRASHVTEVLTDDEESLLNVVEADTNLRKDSKIEPVLRAAETGLIYSIAGATIVGGDLGNAESWEWARNSGELGLGFAIAAQEIAAQLPWVGVVFTASLMLCKQCAAVHACKQSCAELARLAIEVCKILRKANPERLQVRSSPTTPGSTFVQLSTGGSPEISRDHSRKNSPLFSYIL